MESWVGGGERRMIRKQGFPAASFRSVNPPYIHFHSIGFSSLSFNGS
jgi:hypothetical protein